jgi:hypothetical protein
MSEFQWRCDWQGCPSHQRKDVHGRDLITLIWSKQVLYFHATDCLALWAGSFPIGYVTTGKEVDERD